MDAPRTYEIRDSGSQSYCNCIISKAEILHNGRPIDFTQFICLTDSSVTLTHNTRLVRAECDGMVTFTTPGVAGSISLSLCEIEYLREDTRRTAPKPPGRPKGGRPTVAVIAVSAVGVGMLALAIFLHAHR